MTWRHDDDWHGGPPWRHDRWRDHRWRRHHGSRMHARIFFGVVMLTFLVWAAVGTIFWLLGKHGHAPRPWVRPVSLVVPLALTWAFAGLWARRLSRPLRELTQVARDLGDGKLERRARLRHGLGGEVGQLTHAINDMATRIEKQVRDQRELLAAVSHELRTPLARIRVLLEMGREGAKRDVLGDIEGEVMEMDRLVGDLLASARLDFAAQAPRKLDAREAAERALARAAIPDAKLAAESGVMVLADATLLARALAALLDNARKHGGKHVVLRVAARGDRVAFEVDDDGPGFPDGELSRVFEAFYRPASAGATEGLGLGLSIVRRIAEAHGGRAYAENLSPGARVGLELPAANGQ